MKVLVTDFDGTLYVEDSNVVTINENIAALELFKNEKDIYGRNNIVVVSTAREPKSIMKYINLFKIPCDYVISYMGALIWDCAAEKYIYRNYFSSEDATQILAMIKPYSSEVELEIYSDVPNPTINQHIGYIFHNEKNFNNDVFYRMDADFGRPYEKIIDSKEFKDSIYFSRFLSNELSFINNFKNNKLIALDYLLDNIIFKNEEKKNIYTIGDGLDDYGMLSKYSGCRMALSEKDLADRYSKKIESVKAYIDLITRK